ncbi:tetratricopeptide repeat protein [Reticulibacter mediterranei]|uniref:tetratricopeptide repeat protein n=1 Tax=Reticulibacter mediterranei TaxID=2778369 RepID=UPI001C687DC6|nr:tetratricopeptide repeat protein [Reticulibacter mediterranei]
MGVIHPDTAQSLNNLAEFYRIQGRYEEAEPLSQRALAIREAQLSVNHPLAASSNDLPYIFRRGASSHPTDPRELHNPTSRSAHQRRHRNPASPPCLTRAG